MNLLSPVERELAALGASLGSNCVPCTEFHIDAARKAGLTDAQIREAISIADHVRQVPAGKVLATAKAILSGCSQDTPTEQGVSSCCQMVSAGSGNSCCG